MPQLITKLSERRALKKAKATHKRTAKLFEKIGPETVAAFEADLAEKFPNATPKEIAAILIRRYIAEEVKDYTRKALGDGAAFTEEMIESLEGETIEEFLSAMVEGDEIIDDAGVHAFHRRKLDELRASLGKLEDRQKTSLSYEAIRSDYTSAKFLFDLGELDQKSAARFVHMKVYGQTLLEEFGGGGTKATEEDAERIFQITSLGVMASAHDNHGMSIEDIADALGRPPEVVTEVRRFLRYPAHRNRFSPSYSPKGA